MWNLKKMIQMNLLQNRDKSTDMGKKLWLPKNVYFNKNLKIMGS